MLVPFLGDIFQFTELLFAMPKKVIFSEKGCQVFFVSCFFDNLMVI